MVSAAGAKITINFPDKTYVGEIKNDKAHGNGKMTKPNHWVYVG